MDKTIKLLKNKYLGKKHPYWAQEKWIKKVHAIFTDVHYMDNFDLLEQYVKNAELCLIMPDYKQTYKEKIEGKYEEKQSERITIAKSNAKKILKSLKSI